MNILTSFRVEIFFLLSKKPDFLYFFFNANISKKTDFDQSRL